VLDDALTDAAAAVVSSDVDALVANSGATAMWSNNGAGNFKAV
jgi:hypothetical protein